MSDISLPTLPGDLRAKANQDASKVVLHLRGAAEYQDPKPLDDLLRVLHEASLKGSATEVAVDLREVEFMNSSCFKSLVSWISTLEEIDEARRYKVRFLSDEGVLWQRRSLHALKCFAPSLVSVEN
jgi:hypothetical protein